MFHQAHSGPSRTIALPLVACVSRHFYDFSDHRHEASVLRTSALSSRTCTHMQGRQFSQMLAVRRRTGKCGAQHIVSLDGDRSVLLNASTSKASSYVALTGALTPGEVLPRKTSLRARSCDVRRPTQCKNTVRQKGKH